MSVESSLISIENNPAWPGTSFLIVGNTEIRVVDTIAKTVKDELDKKDGSDGIITLALYELLEKLGCSPAARFRYLQ